MSVSNNKEPAGDDQPFLKYAQKLLNQGYLPFPLPPAEKNPPPTGYTGWRPKKSVTELQVRSWLRNPPKGKKSNIGLRIPPGILVIDSDPYKKESVDGSVKGNPMLLLIDAAGADLDPDDVMRVSARTDGVSGHYYFRLTEEQQKKSWPSHPFPNMESIHYGHRYVVAPGSIHPEGGEEGFAETYLAYGPGEEIDGTGSTEMFEIKDIGFMPDELFEYLQSHRAQEQFPEKKLGRSPRESNEAVSKWIEERTEDMCSGFKNTLDIAQDRFNSGDWARHDALAAATFSAAMLAGEGHPGVKHADDALYDMFMAVATDPGYSGETRNEQEAEDEYFRARDSAFKRMLWRADHGHFLGFKCFCAPTDEQGNKKERLNTESIDPNRDHERAYRALAPLESGEGCYLTPGDGLTLVWRGTAKPLSKAGLRVQVSKRMDVVKWKGSLDEGAWTPQYAPDNFLESLFTDPERVDHLPQLSRIVTTPYFAWIGNKPTMITDSGYHPETQTYLSLDPTLENAIDRVTGSPADVTRARKYFYNVLGKFPFESAASKTHAMAMMIQHFVRELIDGPTPLYAISAPEMGTGKTKLATIANIIATGIEESEENRVGWPGEMDELRKQVTSKIARAGSPALMLLDNVSQTFGSDWFASALTSKTYNDRPMHAGMELSVPNKWIWVVTGNNFQLTQEMMRRSLPIRLDAQDPRPWERKFRFDPVERALERRGQLVWAVLTLVTAWASKGAKKGRAGFASFESYSSVVGGITANARYRSFLANRRTFAEVAETEEADVMPLFEEMLDVFGSGSKNGAKPGQLSQLPSAANYAAVHKDNGATNMGVFMTKMIGIRRDLEGHTFVMRRKVSGGNSYFLEREDGVAVAPAAKRIKKAGH